jgi:hypothetical protein
MRITDLIGSGATIEIGGPTTFDITEAICQRNPFIAELRDAVAAFISPAVCTFEDLFHVLETLDSYSTAVQSGVVPEFKPRPAAVLTARDPKWIDGRNILAATRDLVDEVGKIIHDRHGNFDPSGPHEWYAAFWNRIISTAVWDICTLNYDDTIERSIAGSAYEDGFTWIDGGALLGSTLGHFADRRRLDCCICTARCGMDTRSKRYSSSRSKMTSTTCTCCRPPRRREQLGAVVRMTPPRHTKL